MKNIIADQEDIEKKKRKRLQGFDGMYPDPSGLLFVIYSKKSIDRISY